jgi:TP901 family phage tail tape measure protein
VASKDLTIRLLGDLTDLQKKLNQASNDLTKVGSTMTRKVTPAAAATAVALTKLGSDWNSAVDAIIVGTGASGDALEGLLGSTKKVAGQVPNDFGQVGVAIAEVNTRLGLTGPELETTTKAFLDLSRVTGTDVKTNIGLVTRVFGDWSVASEDQAGALDTLFASTQQTGIGIDRLSGLVVQFGAPMRQLGFSLDESIALFGKFEKEGVNIEAVMSGMRMGLGRMAKAGEEPIETFQRLVEQIKEAGSQGEANALALDAFGQRAGPDMAAAIREGRFEIDDLVASLGSSGGALDDAASRTIHLSDRIKILQNRITGALGPFGELGGAAAGVVAGLGPLLFGLGAMAPALAKVGTAFKKLKAVMIGHPLLTIAVVLGAAAVAFGVFGGGVDDSKESVDNLAQAMRDAESPLEGFVETVNQLANESDEVRQAMVHAGVTTLDLAKAAIEGGDAWDTMLGGLQEAAREMEGGSLFAADILNREIRDLAVTAEAAARKNEELTKTNVDGTAATEEASEALVKRAEAEAALAAELASTNDALDATKAANHEATLELREAEEAAEAAAEQQRLYAKQQSATEAFILDTNEAMAAQIARYEATVDAADDFLAGTQSAFDKAQSSISDFSDEAKKDIDTFQAELAENVQAAINWQDNLNTIESQTSPAFAKFMEDLGQDAAGLVADLAKNGDELEETFGVWGLSAGVMRGDVVSEFEKLPPDVRRILETMGVDIDSVLIDIARGVEPEAAEVGANMTAGMARGVRAGVAGLAEEARSAIRTAVAAARQQAGIQSPSKVFAEEVGGPIAEGIAQGIDTKTSDVTSAVQTAVTPPPGLSSGVSGGGGPFELGDDTIRKLAHHMMAAAGVGAARSEAQLLAELRGGVR